MAMAPTVKVVLGSVAFGIFWLLAVFPAVPCLPVGRTAGSLLGAMLMVIFRVISADDAYSSINLPILGLFFGTMIVSIYLERADMFKYLGKLLSWKSRGSKDLLCRICIISAISSALFTNDTSCVVLTEFILKIAKQNNLPPQPFLLALASSANIGSSATPIGNPQNLVIAAQSKITFGKFLLGTFPAMLVGIFVNFVILLCYFWKLLSAEKDIEMVTAASEVFAEDDVVSHRFSPATMSHLGSLNSQDWGSLVDGILQNPTVNRDSSHNETLRNKTSNVENNIQTTPSDLADPVRTSGASREVASGVGLSQKTEDGASTRRPVRTFSGLANGPMEVASRFSSDEKEGSIERWKQVLWKTCVYLVTLGMLVALLMGLNMSWTAMTAALALVVLDFKDAQPCFEKISYPLLIFFCGMFITVDGFNKTGLPSALWDFMEPYARIDSVSGTALLAIVVIVLSNVASNVPTVLLLGARVAASAAAISASDGSKAWLILAWVSTVAGNLSLVGSAANLIVCEQARRAQNYAYNLSFFSHLRFGVPSTLIVTAIGLLLIRS